MAQMKIEDIRAMSPDQQDDAILNLKKERFNLRFQRATGQLENTSRLREARRDIARIKTVAAQTRELLANIDSLIDAANESTQRRQFARADFTYKVYVRNASDNDAIKAEIERWLGAVPRAIYLQADICRTDLLVEVEASAGIDTELSRA